MLHVASERPTPIQFLGDFEGNLLYIKRDDLLPFSFGGNKARKACYFLDDFRRGEYDCIVTYGSGHSNHCRVIANMAAMEGVPCEIISPQEQVEYTFNRQLSDLFGATRTIVSVNDVHRAIENKMTQLSEKGLRPYFIPGGGHGNLGSQAYFDCFREIRGFEQSQGLSFDYVFFATGTGTTHAGLVCGQLVMGGSERIIGISVARSADRGKQIVLGSAIEYLSARNCEFSSGDVEASIHFVDDYLSGGYAAESHSIKEEIRSVLSTYGIPLDPVYTGKAFWGMRMFIRKHSVVDCNVLFIHTGGTPLFFDQLQSERQMHVQ